MSQTYNIVESLRQNQIGLVSGNPTGILEAELRHLTRQTISFFRNISLSKTTVAKSSCFIVGKRISLITSSPRILLFVTPSVAKPCFSHCFVAHKSTALKSSISSIVRESLTTTASSEDLSIVANSSGFDNLFCLFIDKFPTLIH